MPVSSVSPIGLPHFQAALWNQAGLAATLNLQVDTFCMLHKSNIFRFTKKEPNINLSSHVITYHTSLQCGLYLNFTLPNISSTVLKTLSCNLIKINTVT